MYVECSDVCGVHGCMWSAGMYVEYRDVYYLTR